MKLADYLFETKTSPTRFVLMLGGVITCRSTLWRYLTGERIPQPRIMVRITLVTGGAVRLEDFLDPAPPRCSRVVTLPDGTTRRVLPWSKYWPPEDDAPAIDPSPDDPDDPGDADPAALDADADMTPPIERALRVLGSRARFTPGGTFLLDGRVTDLRRLVRAANDVLLRTGQPPIRYPGLENGYE